MQQPIPNHHNPETALDEPVYLFTDKAIVRPPKDNGAPAPAGDQEVKPAAPPPDEKSRP